MAIPASFEADPRLRGSISTGAACDFLQATFREDVDRHRLQDLFLRPGLLTARHGPRDRDGAAFRLPDLIRCGVILTLAKQLTPAARQEVWSRLDDEVLLLAVQRIRLPRGKSRKHPPFVINLASGGLTAGVAVDLHEFADRAWGLWSSLVPANRGVAEG